MISDEYLDFLASKAPRSMPVGIEPGPMPDHLFDFAAHAVRFCLRQGRAALFLDTGLTKTRCQLEFARQAAGASNGVALILTPLAVARQFEGEGLALGYECRVVRDQSGVLPGINICNYDRIELLDASAFGAVCLDESSILKNSQGATSRNLIATFADTPFRLAATATPAPNDHVELGTHAEFLGIMSQSDMLVRWFLNDSENTGTWRLKGHAVEAFWDWVSSWAIMASSPADLGYDGSRFILPPLRIHRHKTIGDVKPMDGSLFAGDVSATNMHEVKRQTASARAAEVARLVNEDLAEPWMIFCDTDYEADTLKAMIHGAVEVRGSMTPEQKEARIAAFLDRTARVMISKPRIMGSGLNLQFCARMAFVGRSFSYELWYQAVRRCWRFGQQRPVDVHLIVAEGEDQIGRVIDQKAEAHAEMKAAMVAASKRAAQTKSVVKVAYNPTHLGRLPEWLKQCDA
tara:strand:+ start:97 stop:1479 length:1383 start_codon:yes stop_codon:yes gene_type:complete